jgi:hypothetical protein
MLRRNLRNRVRWRHRVVVPSLVFKPSIAQVSRTSLRLTFVNPQNRRSIGILRRPLAPSPSDPRLPHPPSRTIHRRTIPLFPHALVVEVVVRRLSGRISRARARAESLCRGVRVRAAGTAGATGRIVAAAGGSAGSRCGRSVRVGAWVGIAGGGSWRS